MDRSVFRRAAVLSRLPVALLAVLGAALVAGCTTLPPSQAQAARGKELAQARCAACHAVAVGELSSNPEAPTFAAIANQQGLNRNTLHTFLRDSHNYPAAMNFTLEPRHVDDLAAYIVTLQSADYHPGI